MSVKKLFLALFGTLFLLMGILLVAVFNLKYSSNELVEATERRYHSYLLADELRQSSDDLTRLARTYVVSGDLKYERQYLDIIDIRNGKKPRPEHYERIYWDFVAAGNEKPRPDGPAVALLDLMKEAGFVQAEFAKLKEAEENSSALVKTEIIAMNAIKGLVDDGSGRFVKTGTPDPVLARNLVHSDDYHRHKAKIMTPVNDFFDLLDRRTGTAVAQARESQGRMQYLVTGLIGFAVIVLMAALWFTYRRIIAALGGEPALASEVVSQVSAGNLSVSIPVAASDRSSLLAMMKVMQSNLQQLIGGIQTGAAKVATAATHMTRAAEEGADASRRQSDASAGIAAAVEEATVSISQMSDSAQTAQKISIDSEVLMTETSEAIADTVERISNIALVVGDASQTVQALGRESENISKIVGVIKEIADQTNLLALNAAIEAARAGEQGRGFAVVADEVRKLSERTGQATQEIAAMINAMRTGANDAVARIEEAVTKVNDGVSQAMQVGESVGQLKGSSQDVRKVVSDVSAALREQNAASAEIARNVEQIAQMTESNSLTVDAISSAAADLQELATSLTKSVQRFNNAPG